jgi:hypothetical protein
VTAQVWMGPGRHFVHYFVRNRRLLNFVAIVEQDRWTRESWTDRGDLADALAAFEGFHLPDGPEQRERDAQMASGLTDWSFRAAAWIYEHDAALAD